MASAARITRYTPEQYLEMERKADFKSEYVDDTLRLASIDCEVSLREIYDKVEFSGEADKA